MKRPVKAGSCESVSIVVGRRFFFALCLSVSGCVAQGAAEFGTNTDGIRGGLPGGHPNTVIMSTELIALYDPTENYQSERALEPQANLLSSANFRLKVATHCMAMFVRSNLVVTARHCVDIPPRLPLDSHYLRLFRNRSAEGPLGAAREMEIKYPWSQLKVYRHPTADLAFIQIPEHVQKLEPVELYLHEASAAPMNAIVDGRMRYAANGELLSAEELYHARVLVSQAREAAVPRMGLLMLDDPFTHLAYDAVRQGSAPYLADSGDSGGPLYQVRDDGVTMLYGVAVSLIGPKTKKDDEIESACAEEMQWCKTSFASFKSDSRWVEQVLKCADTDKCADAVLDTRSSGYGFTATLLPLDASICPSHPLTSYPVAEVSFYARSNRKDYATLGLPYRKDVADYYLQPSDFSSSHHSKSAFAAQIEAPLRLADRTNSKNSALVAPIFHPAWIAIKDPEVRITECVMRDWESMSNEPIAEHRKVYTSNTCRDPMRESVALSLRPMPPRAVDLDIITAQRSPTGEDVIAKTPLNIDPVDPFSGDLKITADKGYDLRWIVIEGQQGRDVGLGYRYFCE